MPADRILVGGSASSGLHERWAFARYLNGGAPDSSFGGDGRVTMSLSPSGEEVQDLVIDSGEILAAGYAESGFLPRFAIAKLRSDGSRMASFGNNGVKIVNVAVGADAAFGLAVQADGKPVLAGYASGGGRADWGLVRLRAGGGLDGGFGGDGISDDPRSRPPTSSRPRWRYSQDGRILVVGRARGPSGTDDLAVVRYGTAAASTGRSRGTGRRSSTPTVEDDAARDVLVHDGKVLVVGDSMQNLVPRMVVLRIRMA